MECFVWFFLDFFGDCLIFNFFLFVKHFYILVFFFKSKKLLLKVTKVTTDHQKLPKYGPKYLLKAIFCPKGNKSLGQRPKSSAGAKRRPA